MIPLFIWFAGIAIIISTIQKFFHRLPDWKIAFLNNIALCIGGLTAIILMVFLVRLYFTGKLKGFGLNPKTIIRDFLLGFVNLLSIWPLVILALVLTIILGTTFFGPDFKVPQHEELQLISRYPQISLRIVIFICAALIVPVFEEMLFRGLFQTMIRSILVKPWRSIAISSGLFAIMHSHPGHWPALFVLGMCMGYAYEKSGSLFRPIFIHLIFNGTTVVFVLCGG
jgi:membrane protease YdiL (CAAX protease family)